MIGLRRLDNIQFCIKSILEEGIPGDFIETGVWRGGATIFMKGCLCAYAAAGERLIWVCDSFEGLPRPNPDLHPADAIEDHSKVRFLAVSQEEVQENFRRYNLLDEKVRFLKGWFKDTLPDLKTRTWSLMRLDGDLYESTMNALDNLYDGLSPGGYVIVDDYGCLECCREAVSDFRAKRNISSPIVEIDWTGVYWRKN